MITREVKHVFKGRDRNLLEVGGGQLYIHSAFVKRSEIPELIEALHAAEAILALDSLTSPNSLTSPKEEPR